MERQPFDVIAELDAQTGEFGDKLRIGMKELHHALMSGYVFEDYMHPSDAILAAEAVQRKLERLLSQVQEYLDSRHP